MTDGQAAPEAASLAGVVRDAQERIARATRIGEMRGDPLCDVLEAISVSLGAQLRLHEAGTERVGPSLDRDVLERLEQAAATGAQRRAAELARAYNRRSLLAYAALLVCAVLGAGAGGALWGRASAEASAQETARDLAVAFRAGPGAAATWLSLMQNNDPEAALGACRGSAGRLIEGRRACNVPLWLDPPKLSVPADERRR